MRAMTNISIFFFVNFFVVFSVSLSLWNTKTVIRKRTSTKIWFHCQSFQHPRNRPIWTNNLFIPEIVLSVLKNKKNQTEKIPILSDTGFFVGIIQGYRIIYNFPVLVPMVLPDYRHFILKTLWLKQTARKIPKLIIQIPERN